MPDRPPPEGLPARIEQLEALYRMSEALIRAEKIEEILEEGMEAVLRCLDADRAAVLLKDTDGVMRFRAWRGLSDEYRLAVEGHSPWPPGARNPEPVLVPDVLEDPELAPLREVIRREGVRSLAFIPLVAEGAVAGKLMVYRDEPGPFEAQEVRLAEAIARRISAAIHRRRSEEALRVSRDQLEVILRGVADGITVQDRSGQLVFANDAAARAIGFSTAEDLVSTPVAEIMRMFELLDEDGRPFPLERLPGRLALAGQETPRVTIRWRRVETGDERWSVVRATPVFGEDGRVQLAVNIFQDVTDERWVRESSRILAQVSEEVGTSLEYEATLSKVARLLIPTMADLSVMYLVEDEEPFRLVVAHRDPEQEALLNEYARRHPVDRTRPHPVLEAMERGEPQLIPEIPDELLEGFAHDAEHLRIIRELRLRSSMVVPLMSRGEALGALVLTTTVSGRRYEQEDLALAMEVARRAVSAVENARLHRAERQARREAEETARRVSRLQAVTSALSDALSRDQVAEVVEELILTSLGASAGSLVLLSEDGSALEVARAVGYPEELMSRWGRFPLDAPVPLAEAVRTGKPVFIETREELEAQYPHLVRGDLQPAGEAWVALPVVSEGKPVGAIGLTFPRPRRFGDVPRAYKLALADQVGQALDRARLYEAERAARDQAMAAGERLSFLAEAAEILASSLDYQKTLAKFADLCIPRMADWVSVDVLDEGGAIRQLAVAHVEPDKAELARELRRRYPPDRRNHPISRVVLTGISEVEPEVDLRRNTVDEENLRLLQELGATSHMVVPLVARGRVFGAVSFVSGRSGRRYRHADVALAEELARRAGLALDNARLYEDRSRVARTLQRSLLPTTLPSIPGFEVAARYHPAGEGNEVGGDFYDLFRVADDDWALVIGDVCGKGAEAAALTGLARHTVRTASTYERAPTAVLEALNGAILREGLGRFCTVTYGRLDVSTEPAKLTVVCGGHPAPLLLRGGGKVEQVGVLGTLLGTFPDPSLEARTTEVHPGDAVLFYTDGVVEEGRVGVLPGEERLQELLRLCSRLDAELIADRIERHAAEFRVGPPRDDVAILALRRTP